MTIFFTVNSRCRHLNQRPTPHCVFEQNCDLDKVSFLARTRTFRVVVNCAICLITAHFSNERNLDSACRAQCTAALHQPLSFRFPRNFRATAIILEITGKTQKEIDVSPGISIFSRILRGVVRAGMKSPHSENGMNDRTPRNYK